MSPPKTGDWIDDFIAQTSVIPSPEIFRRWTAIATISAALQRRAYIVVRGEKLFCNLYIFLVGPPATGKTRAIRSGYELVRRYSNIRLLPQKTSASKVIASLVGSFQSYTSAEGVNTMCAISGFFDEIANFIAPRDYDFMTQLTDWYDSPKQWTYETRMRGEEKAENVYLSFIGGITPRMLGSMLGPQAFGMGFTSRINMIFSEDITETDPFASVGEVNLEPLHKGMEHFTSFSGEFTISEKAKEIVRDWVLSGMHPLPADSRFAEYNPRRWIHWLKLGMIHAIADNKTEISDQHILKAKETLLEAEFVMPLALEFLGNNPMAEAVKNLHMWALTDYVTNKRQPISESRLLRKLMSDVPQQYHSVTIEHMISTGMLKVLEGQPPNRKFIPQMVDRVN
jgi:hypothetical protein